jgi:hypothetical protein
MKKFTKGKGKINKFEPGEHIRVVPLDYPKPVVAIGEREPEGGDPFDGKPHPAAANAKLTYRGGVLLTNVEVFTIFWGKLWGSNKTSIKMMSDINKFFTAILVSPALDQLGEYSVPNKTIGHGSVIGMKVISANAPVGSVTDSTIRKQLKQWIRAKTVPKPTNNTLYFIYLDPKVVSIMGGSRSCQNYCGYHDNVGSVYYGVMPYPTCSGCLGGEPAFAAITGTSSHELCEAITDPAPGAGWYDDVNGEIGDICAWNFKRVGGYNVQLEWSNQQNKCA